MVPAKQAELVELAKAMHREKFGAHVNHLFQWEKNAALNAIQTGEPRQPSRGLLQARVHSPTQCSRNLPIQWIAVSHGNSNATCLESGRGAGKWAKVDGMDANKKWDIHIKPR